VPLEVCPTSNLGIGLYPELAAHPLPRLLASGLAVSLASDDPPMFSTSLIEEFERCAAAFGGTPAQVRALAAAAVRHSFMSESTKVEILGEQSRVAVEVLGAGDKLPRCPHLVVAGPVPSPSPRC
jgi:adenosine deaminase